jgi:hypothetical protein
VPLSDKVKARRRMAMVRVALGLEKPDCKTCRHRDPDRNHPTCPNVHRELDVNKLGSCVHDEAHPHWEPK